MPKTGSPTRVSAINVPQAGMPVMKDLVPSIGSSTQTVFGIGTLVAELLADDAVIGKAPADQGAHRGFGGVIGGGHRIEAAGAALVLDAERGAEERQDGFAGDRRQPFDEGRKINGRHARMRPLILGSSLDYRRPGTRGNRFPACRAAGAVRRRGLRPVLGRSKAGDHEHPKRFRTGRGPVAIAIALVATLGSLYIVSQFLRNSVGVIAPNLADEIGLTPIEIGLLSSAFFFVFAAAQIAARGGARPFRPEAVHAGVGAASPCWAAVAVRRGGRARRC